LQVAARARSAGIGAVAALVLITSSAAAPASVEATTPADRVISIARAQLGDPWVYGAAGPSSFDCSGLVIYAFKQAGYGSVIGDGKYRSARALYDWFRSRGRAATSGGQRGDLVVYGGGSHIGIYLGDGRVISTLTSGVAIHGLHAVTASFTAFLRTGMSSGTTTTSTTSFTMIDIANHVRYTTARVNMRTGPGTGYASVGVLPSGSKLLATKYAKDSLGRTWYRVYSYKYDIRVWVAGWYTRR
jgi:cell wall-associated NlpC family hydrolase